MLWEIFKYRQERKISAKVTLRVYNKVAYAQEFEYQGRTICQSPVKILEIVNNSPKRTITLDSAGLENVSRPKRRVTAEIFFKLLSFFFRLFRAQELDYKLGRQSAWPIPEVISSGQFPYDLKPGRKYPIAILSRVELSHGLMRGFFFDVTGKKFVSAEPDGTIIQLRPDVKLLGEDVIKLR